MLLYRLLTGPDDSAFCHKVSKAVSAGWQLHGSPAYTFDAKEGVRHCAQAVTKEVPGVEYEDAIRLSDY